MELPSAFLIPLLQNEKLYYPMRIVRLGVPKKEARLSNNLASFARSNYFSGFELRAGQAPESAILEHVQNYGELGRWVRLGKVRGLNGKSLDAYSGAIWKIQAGIKAIRLALLAAAAIDQLQPAERYTAREVLAHLNSEMLDSDQSELLEKLLIRLTQFYEFELEERPLLTESVPIQESWRGKLWRSHVPNATVIMSYRWFSGETDLVQWLGSSNVTPEFSITSLKALQKEARGSQPVSELEMGGEYDEPELAVEAEHSNTQSGLEAGELLESEPEQKAEIVEISLELHAIPGALDAIQKFHAAEDAASQEFSSRSIAPMAIAFEKGDSLETGNRSVLPLLAEPSDADRVQPQDQGKTAAKTAAFANVASLPEPSTGPFALQLASEPVHRGRYALKATLLLLTSAILGLMWGTYADGQPKMLEARETSYVMQEKNLAVSGPQLVEKLERRDALSARVLAPGIAPYQVVSPPTMPTMPEKQRSMIKKMLEWFK